MGELEELRAEVARLRADNEMGRMNLAHFRELVDREVGRAEDAEGSLIGGAGLIAAERRRQIDGEGYAPSGDQRYEDDQLARAAAAYATPQRLRRLRAIGMPGNTSDRGDAYAWTPELWPWSWSTFKPTPDDRVRELVKAGALIAAEIDRLRGR